MADNLSISPERQEEIASQYVEGSIWYRRDILGERCIAEGLIYPMYEEAKGIPDTNPKTADLSKFYSEIGLSIDYGTQNAFAAILWGLHEGVWYAYRGYYYSGHKEGYQKTDEDYADDLDCLTDDVVLQYGQKLEVIIDPSAASMKATLKKRGRYKVRDAVNDVDDGLRETATALQKGLVKISPKLTDFWKEISGYVWDNKKDGEKEQPIKYNDHYMDALRYWVKTKHLVRKRNRNSIERSF